MAKTYHLALVDGGHGRAIIEVADSVDQVSCECLEYYGERETTIEGLRERFGANPAATLAQINIWSPRPAQPWTAWTIRRVASADYTAGHVDRVA